MRKVVGARRSDLIRQFIGESFLFTVFAMIISLFLFYAFFPLFSSFLGNSLTLNELNIFPLVLSVLATIIIVGAVSGIYPAFVLSSFQPSSILKNQFGNWLRGVRIRNLLVIAQFSAVIVLMIGTIVITRQLNFIRNIKLGYEREHVVVVPLIEEDAIEKASVIRTSLLEYPKIKAVTLSDSTPLRMASSFGGMEVKKENGETIKIDSYMAGIDYSFLNVYSIKIKEGRNFSPDFPSDAKGVLVNNVLVRKVGWREPLSKKLNESEIVGVIENFHIDTLHKAIEPTAFFLTNDFSGPINVGIRITPEDHESALAEIKNIFTQVTSGQPFDFYFLEDAYNRLYRNEQRLAAMIGYLEALSIILGCMGLFGLATYAAERRTKEIGIRKVLGASVFSIIRLMSKEFLVLVVISNIIAWPLGYYFLERWLQGYAYHCSFGIEIFLLAGMATLLIAFAAVGLHTFKASWASPLKSIRYE
jgi:ABC-type antimicrobial peptide transport system permease subunit